MDFAASSFEYVNQNTVHPVGLAALAIACALIAFGPVRMIPLVLLGLAVYIPSAQRLVLAGADFAFLRLGIMVALVRLGTTGRLFTFRFGWIDGLVAGGTLAKAALTVLTALNSAARCWVSLNRRAFSSATPRLDGSSR